jgi:transcriptional regulator with XRE-family HTH domain
VENADEVIARVGRRIGELRESAGLTQAKAAEELRMTVSNYQRIEHGLQNLSIRTMVRVAQVVGVPVAKLFEAATSRRGSRGRPKKR